MQKNEDTSRRIQINQNAKQQKSAQSTDSNTKCPYLGTIKRHLLDFDFEKVCCLSLQTNNIYGCLVCGRYFSGKGSQTPAYLHSIEVNHYLYINLSTTEVHCLPDNYIVKSHTLEDIKFNLNPHYTKEDLQRLYKLESEYNIDGKEYIPGVIGMNNLGGTDYVNVVLQVLNAIKEFRDFLLLSAVSEEQENKSSDGNVLFVKITNFYKKLWNNRNFKGLICPHELMQAISDKSNKTFKIGTKGGDPVAFFVWLVNNLTKVISKQTKKGFNLLGLFEGQVKTSLIKGIKDSPQYQSAPSKVETKNFIILRLEFPQKGIFNKTKNQTPLRELIEKYSGQKGIAVGDGLNYTKVIGFPKYLMVVFKRFEKTEYKVEKNSSEVKYNGDLQINSKGYRLLAQICHEGEYETGRFYAHVFLHGRWFQMEDLIVKEIVKKDVLLGQPYMQLYQLSD